MKKGQCKYYKSPLHHKECHKSINYLKLATGTRLGYVCRLPCITNSASKDQQHCELYKDPTDKEINAFNKAVDEKIASFIKYRKWLRKCQ